ncbi:MAG TPA: hypothetical protein DHU96_28825, partial [Actinobacteria bacterium]|nr:hypothetical protein [Actinomycetota bacterium]
GFGGFGHFSQAFQPGMTSRIIVAIGSIIAGTVTAPIFVGVADLLYVDLRMRREGLDLVLQTATGDGQPAGDEFATVWRPSGPAAPAPPAGPGPAATPAPPAAGAPPAW